MDNSKNSKIKFGHTGEEIACRYLLKNNYNIIRKNYRCKFGEIDIISYDKNEIVFIEVKSRSNICYGEPREAVDLQKKKHIKQTAEFYVMKNKLENFFIRFDVIEVYLYNENYKINHIQNIW